jgi:hypothetical protein
MTAAELGRQLKVPANRITEILNGLRTVTGDMALRLGHFFPHERAVLAELAGHLRSAGGRALRLTRFPSDSAPVRLVPD